VKVGAAVLPWSPLAGGYLLVEQGAATASDLVDTAGVAGAWWGVTIPVEPVYAGAPPDLHITLCFLDDDPVETAERLRPVLDKRWSGRGVVPLLAAPFYTVNGDNLGRHLP